MFDEYMLTTMDNPYDPFEDFDSWFRFDTDNGYYTCSYLARIAIFTDDMTQKEENEAVEMAIDEIITLNPLGIYKKVKRKIK